MRRLAVAEILGSIALAIALGGSAGLVGCAHGSNQHVVAGSGTGSGAGMPAGGTSTDASGAVGPGISSGASPSSASGPAAGNPESGAANATSPTKVKDNTRKLRRQRK